MGIKRNYKNILSIIVAFILMISCSGCTNILSTESNLESIDTETSEVFKGTDSEKAFKILGLLDDAEIGDNSIISPISLNFVLSMIGNCSSEKAKKQIESYFGYSIESLNEEYKQVLKNQNNSIMIGNSIWIRESLINSVSSNIKNQLSINYSAEIFNLNNSIDDINKWASDNTNGMVDNLVDNITEDLKILILNTIYFDGKWVEPFNKNDIIKSEFNCLNGDTVSIDMLSGKADSYMENSQAIAFRKHYKDGYSFIGILPKQYSYSSSNEMSAIKSLENLNFDTLIESETDKFQVDIKIPKFSVEYKSNLNDVIKSLGLNSIFEDGSLSNILLPEANIDSAITKELKTKDVIQTVVLDLNENGTTVSAITAAFAGAPSNKREIEKKEIILDRPFVYLIVESETNKIQFIGQINNLVE